LNIEHPISFLAQVFCVHVQMPGSTLLETIITRYFQHMGITQLRVYDFAQELSSLVWALCECNALLLTFWKPWQKRVLRTRSALLMVNGRGVD